jgi:hypothetical protein
MLRLWKSPMTKRYDPKNYKPIQFHQLCALVKTIIQQDPSIDDAEWKARARDTMAKWNFQEPDAATLGRAMSQVEYALKQTVGPRPIRETPVPVQPQTVAQEPPQPAGRTHSPAGWDIVVGLMAKLQKGCNASALSSLKPSGPRETLAVTEEAALDEFWRAACREEGTDRLALLRAFAEIAIVRPPDWNYLEVRKHSKEHTLAAMECFACRGDEHSNWHHVIQIQHGGSNYLRNRVAICGACHSAIHPWLPKVTKRGAGGWFQAGGVPAADFKPRKREIA